MNLRSRFLSRSLFAALWMVCLGLVLAGCDSSGSSESSDPSSTGTQTFDVTVVAVDTPAEGLIKSGTYGGANPPIGPGESVSFTFTAGPNVVPKSGMKLSFVSMFGQSNDAFYAPQPGGIDLFQDDASNDRQDPTPIGLNQAADVTSNVALWDAGTEADQEPGFGDNQAPRQSSPGQGPDQDGNVNLMEDIDSDGNPENDKNGNGQLDADNNEYEFPAVSDAMMVTVSSQVIEQTGSSNSGVYEFTVTIKNVSDEKPEAVLTSESSNENRPVAISPGVFAAHIDQNPVSGNDVTFFAADGTAEDAHPVDGLKEIAEDANVTPRANAVEPITGVLVPFSPGTHAVHSSEVSFHNNGGSASDGIKLIAEDGNPGMHESTLSETDGVESSGTFGSGPTPPGMNQSFTIEADPGDRFSLATMFIQSNDFYLATPENGIELFNDDDTPISGDVTSQIDVYDAGTEPEEEPGVGRTQAPRQPASGDFGPDEDEDITEVTDGDGDGLLEKEGFEYDQASDVVKVTITPQ